MPRPNKIAADIRKQQESTKTVIPHTSFQRLVAEIIQNASSEDDNFCVREEAVNALQCEAESFLTQLFSEAKQLAEYNKRDTVTQSDIKFVLNLRNFSLPDCTSNEMQDALTAPCAAPSHD